MVINQVCPPPLDNSQSSRTNTTTTLVREYTTVLIEPPKKLPLKDGPTKMRNTTITEPAYNTVLIEPPRKPCSTHQWTKKGITNEKQTKGKAATPASIQPRKIKSRLDVVRIPCDGPPFRKDGIPLIAIGNGGINPKDCVPGEEWLVKFPNLWSIAHESRFNWRRRSLIGIPAKHLGSSVERNLLDVCVLRGDGRCPAQRSIWRKFRGFKMKGESFLFKVYTDFDVDGKIGTWDRIRSKSWRVVG